MKSALTLILLSVLSTSPMASPEDISSGYEQEAMEARALLGKAVERYKAVGDTALAEFSRQGEFTRDNFYIYVVDIQGKMLASGGPSAILIGRDVSPLLDDSLREAFTQVLNAPPSSEIQSREYRWTNWHDNKVERKRVFYQRIDNKIFASGYYMPRSSQAEAQRLLEEAIVELEGDDVRTLQRINRLDPYFNRDDLYVYIVDFRSERFVAHGFQSRLLNTDFRALTTNTGEAVGQKVLDAIAGKREAEASYGWVNPVTGKRERKQVLIRRSGDYLVAVGYYLK